MEAGAQMLGGISLPLVHGSELLKAITIPLFTGAIGYVINWTGVWMLFYPVRFAGFRLRGLAPLVTLLPRRVQQVPGFMHGAVGWQGIIPSRAAKMGSIAVDKGIAKLGSPSEFYRQLDPERIAEHIIATSREDIRDVVEADHAPRASGPLGRPAPARSRPCTRGFRSSCRRSSARSRRRSATTSTSCSTSSSWSSARWRSGRSSPTGCFATWASGSCG